MSVLSQNLCCYHKTAAEDKVMRLEQYTVEIRTFFNWMRFCCSWKI